MGFLFFLDHLSTLKHFRLLTIYSVLEVSIGENKAALTLRGYRYWQIQKQIKAVFFLLYFHITIIFIYGFLNDS